MPTPMNTLWHGSVVLRDGVVTATGVDPAPFKVATDERGLSRLTFQDVKIVQRFDVSDADFANLLVKVIADEE